MMSDPILIVGAGQGGFQVAASLRARGYLGPITIIGDEESLPYQRPPLSKSYLGDRRAQNLLFKPRQFFDDMKIALYLGARAEKIDRASKQVFCEDGRAFPYSHLVLATGAQARRLPIEGIDTVPTFQLRSLADADAIADELLPGRRLVVIGGGFIGLELAAHCAQLDMQATVIELDLRLMRRAITEQSAAFLQSRHEVEGVRFIFGASVRMVSSDPDQVARLELSNGDTIFADVLVVAAGASPRVELAEDSGLLVDNGVVVDEYLRTSDPSIYAIGDCAAFPLSTAETRIRLESVQCAVDHGKAVAAHILGVGGPYRKSPWFWSDQGKSKLQIAGMTAKANRVHAIEYDDGLAVFCFAGDQFLGLETINLPGPHLICRRVLDRHEEVLFDDLAKSHFDLRELLANFDALLETKEGLRTIV